MSIESGIIPSPRKTSAVGIIAQPKIISSPVSISKVFPALFAAALGLALIFAGGFAETKTLHSTTHDTRHATGFPCH